MTGLNPTYTINNLVDAALDISDVRFAVNSVRLFLRKNANPFKKLNPMTEFGSPVVTADAVLTELDAIAIKLHGELAVLPPDLTSTQETVKDAMDDLEARLPEIQKYAQTTKQSANERLALTYLLQKPWRAGYDNSQHPSVGAFVTEYAERVLPYE